MNINYSKKEVIAFEKGYVVLDDGSVIGAKGKPIKLGKMPSDYFTFTIRHYNGKTINIAVHRLLAYQKYGDKLFENGIVVRHLDGNHLNNYADNIAIGTQSDNILDIPKEVRCERSKNANENRKKYTKEQISEIKIFYNNGNSGYTLKQTKEKFNISSIGKLRDLLKK